MSAEAAQVHSRLGNLQHVWEQKDSIPLGVWASEVSSAYFSVGLELIPAADFLRVQPAELHAALSLATLEEASLELISASNPPITTWYFLAECPAEGLPEVLEALDKRPVGKSAADAAKDAVMEKLGPSISDLIAQLDSSVFRHLAEKAAQHGALNDKGRKALKGFSTWLKNGKALTLKQVSYAHGLLEQLADQGVISPKSPDGDQEMMDAVLKMLGRQQT